MSAGNRSCIFLLVGLICLFWGFYALLPALLGNSGGPSPILGLAALIAGSVLLIRGRRAFSIDE